MTTATALIVMSCRFRYALAPSCTAAEICRIRSLPADFRLTAAIKKNAKTRPMTAHNIDNCTPESSKLRARKTMASDAIKRTTLWRFTPLAKPICPAATNSFRLVESGLAEMFCEETFQRGVEFDLVFYPLKKVAFLRLDHVLEIQITGGIRGQQCGDQLI